MRTFAGAARDPTYPPMNTTEYDATKVQVVSEFRSRDESRISAAASIISTHCICVNGSRPDEPRRLLVVVISAVP